MGYTESELTITIVSAWGKGGFLLHVRILIPLHREIAWWMLDLYFGLDASGFDKSSQSSLYTRYAVQDIEDTPPSSISQVFGTDYDGHIRVPQ